MNIRLLEKTDYNKFIDLINQFRPVGMKIDKEQFSLIYDEIFSNGFIFVIEDNDTLIGTAKIHLERKFFHKLAIYAHIEDVLIDPSFRGKKLGVKLITHLVDFCEEKQYYKIKLNCDEKLVNFYERNNFSVSGVDMSRVNDKKHNHNKNEKNDIISSI